MRYRRSTFYSDLVASMHQSQLQRAPSLQPMSADPLPSSGINEAIAYDLYPVGSLLRCSLLGFSAALLAEALSDGRLNGFNTWGLTTGVAIIVRTVAGSETLQYWLDRRTDLSLAHEVASQQWERQRMAWQQTETAAQAVEMVNSQPSAEDELVNQTISAILRDYFTAKAAGQKPNGKLWSRRNLAKCYHLGQFSKANARVREILEKHGEGNHLKAHTYRAAFWTIFGADPADWRDVQLIRVADNPATGDPVFVPQARPA